MTPGFFERFRGPPQCPIDDRARQWVDERWHWLGEQFGADRPRRGAVVMADGTFFPDPWSADESSAARVLARLCGYMDVEPSVVQMELFDDRHPLADTMAVGKSSGTRGKTWRSGDRYVIGIERAELRDPLGLLSTMAREVSHIHLFRRNYMPKDFPDAQALSDLLTVYLGLGVVTANSVVIEYTKREFNRTRWAASRRGALSMPTYGYALSHFAQSRGDGGKPWSRKLRPDVRSAFKLGQRYLAAGGGAAARPKDA